ncbi:Ig-like domain-containing protein [Longispora sp. K20-0274]|uniref:Ig-like domain-containing protein n=1 Tax=Longispora sp. K20-0274 TaxID=3088255 RepID=UPI00399C3EB2
MKGTQSLFARGAALVSATVLASAAALALAAPAQAAALGTLTLSQASGDVNDAVMFAGATTSAACPTGYGTNATLKVGKVGGPYNNLQKVQSAGGYDTAPFTIGANRSFTTSNLNTPPAPGDYQVVMVCTSETAGDHPDMFVTDIKVVGTTWSLKTTAPAQDTTTAFGIAPAGPVAFGTNVTLTATVSPATAAGTVEFRRGATVVGTSPVSGGTATLTSNTLSAGNFAMTASFVPADTAAYKPSVSSAQNYAVTPPAGVIQKPQTITADVAPGAFSLELAGNAVTLAGGIVGGTATGALNQATVVDLRGTNAGWNLVGQVENFTGAAGTIGADNLGWTPSANKVSGSGAVVAGSAAPNGLGSAKTLCKAVATTSAGTFKCGAGLSLNIPDTTAPGSYSATFTLTLS